MASKAKSFWADLYTTKGIDQENIRWENVHHWECAPSDDTCAYRHWDYNFPVADGYDKEDVLNPKDVVSDAHKNVTFLSSEMTRAPGLMTKGTFSLDADDLVDALSLPISMVADAVDSIGQGNWRGNRGGQAGGDSNGFPDCHLLLYSSNW